MCSVVLMHIYFGGFEDNHPLRALLGWSWHVAVFFLIAGFFINVDKLTSPKSFITKKLKTVYLMLLCYYIPAVLLHNFFFDIDWYSTDCDYGRFIQPYSFLDTLKSLLLTIFFAGREPIVGPLWFVYVMVMAFIGYSILSAVLKKFSSDYNNFELKRTVIILALCAFFSTLTECWGFTIPRFSNLFAAIWLIHFGFLAKNVFTLKFDNALLALLSLVLVLHLSFTVGSMRINFNDFHNVAYLTVNSFAALYLVCFISQKIQHSIWGRCLEYIGANSFHILALHFFSFKLTTELINLTNLGGGVNSYDLVPSVGTNYILVPIYFASGILFPLAFINLFRIFKVQISKLLQRSTHFH